MSLINDMLRNLEQRHAASAPLPNEVRPLPAESPGIPWKLPLAALGVTAAAAAAFLALRDAGQSPPPPPVAAIVAAPATIPPPPPVPVPPLPPPAEAAPPAQLAPPPAAAVTQPAAPVEKPAAPPVSHAERRAAAESLRLATSLPSLERTKGRDAAVPAAAPAAPAAEKAVAEPDPAVQAEADLRRARELLAQGRRAEAEALFKHALAALPAQTEAAMTLARLQVDGGDGAAAWETLSRSLPHARQQAAYRAFCGTVLQRLNRSREAVEHYQAALRLNPGEGRWWVGLGLALEGAGQAAEARDAFQRARAAGNLPPEMAAFAEQKAR